LRLLLRLPCVFSWFAAAVAAGPLLLLLLLLLLRLLTLLCHPSHDEPTYQLQVCDDLAAMRSSIHEASCPDHAWALRKACRKADRHRR
jgi:hypothetical protein